MAVLERKFKLTSVAGSTVAGQLSAVNVDKIKQADALIAMAKFFESHQANLLATQRSMQSELTDFMKKQRVIAA